MKKFIRYHTLDAWLRNRYGEKVQKIPLDAGSSCPNRDGSIARGGCIFCNAIGSGSGRGHLSLTEQWNYWRERFAASDRLKHTRLFLGYLQAFTNTYGPVERLASIMDSLKELPGLTGLCIGTRPDCLDEEKMAVIAGQNLSEMWLELGVQSCHNRTLERIKRGHDAKASEKAILLAHKFGVKTCVHLMADLPGENREDFLETVRWVSALPVTGVKLHSLYVCENTALENDWKQGAYTPQSQNEYVETVAQALALLPSSIVIHRLTGDPAPGELVAPAWAASKGETVRAIDRLLDELEVWQGCRNDAPEKNPFMK